jgi:MFS family permease
MNREIFTRDFVLSFFSQFTGTSITSMLLPTLPIYLSALGAREAEIGALIGVFSVSSLIFRPLVGRGLLNVPERTFMLVGTLVYFLASMGYLWARPFLPLFLVRAFHGAGLAFFSTSVFTLVTSIAPEAHRGQTVSYFFLAINLATAVAPVAGMFLLNFFDFTVLFLVCAGLALCTFLITLRLRKAQGAPIRHRSRGDPSFLSREALPPAVIAFVSSILWGAVSAFFPLYAISRNAGNPGYFFAAYAITLILVRSLSGRILDVYAREKVLLPCFAAQTSAMMVLAFSGTLPLFILVAVLWGIGSSYLYPAMVVYAVERAGPSRRGPAMATFTAFSDLGAGLGPVMMGIVLELSSYRLMFLCLAFCGLVNFLYFFFSLFETERKRQSSWDR